MGRHRGRKLAIAVVLAARPSPADVAVKWQAPPECPTQRMVAGRANDLARGANADAEVVVSAGPDAFSADLTVNVNGTSSARTVRDASCQSLGESVALIVAMAAATPPEATPARLPAEPPTTADDPSDRFAFGIFGGGGLGLSPVVSGAVGVRASLYLGRWIVSARGEYGFPADASVASDSSKGARISRVGGTAHIGYVVVRASDVGIELAIGAAAGGALVRAEGYGVRSSVSDSAATGLFGEAVEVRVPLARHVALLAEQEFLVSTSAREWQLIPYGKVFKPSIVHGNILLGAEVRF